MFSWRDIPILAIGWAIIFFVALVLDASSLVLHLATYAVVVAVVSAHYIWEEIAVEGSFQLHSRKRQRARDGGSSRAS
jgi:hypothetical protein